MVRSLVAEGLVTGSEDSIEKAILGLVREQLSAPLGGQLTAETDLITEGIIDSLSVLLLLRKWIEHFDLSMDLSHLKWADFETVQTMTNLVLSSRLENRAND